MQKSTARRAALIFTLLIAILGVGITYLPLSAFADETELTVTVQTPGGKPLPHLTIVPANFLPVANTIYCVTVSGTNLIWDRHLHPVITDRHGQFKFIPSATNTYFITASPSGFAVGQSRDLTNQPVIVVQPWARVEGVRLNRGQAVTHQPIMLAYDAQSLNPNALYIPGIGGNLHTITDSQGRFSFDHVPPGSASLTEESRAGIWDQLQHTSFAPGENRFMKVETDGFSIICRIELTNAPPEYLPLSRWRFFLDPVAPYSHGHSTIPQKIDTPAQRTAWWEAWYASRDGQLLNPPVDKSYTPLILQTNGLLFSSHVCAPGRYWLGGELMRDHREQIATVGQEVYIPSPAPGDATNNTCDLGQFPLEPEPQHHGPGVKKTPWRYFSNFPAFNAAK